MIGRQPTGVIAIYPDAPTAHTALQALWNTGIDTRIVSILGPHSRSPVPPPELDQGTKHALDVAAYWAEWGAIVGAGVGAAVVAVPMIAAVVGLGPFAVALAAIPVASAAFGAGASAFIGLGIHEAHAQRYESALRDGKILVIVHTDELATLEDARAALKTGAERIDTHGLRALRGSWPISSPHV